MRIWRKQQWKYYGEEQLCITDTYSRKSVAELVQRKSELEPHLSRVGREPGFRKRTSEFPVEGAVDRSG